MVKIDLKNCTKNNWGIIIFKNPLILLIPRLSNEDDILKHSLLTKHFFVQINSGDIDDDI